MKSNKEIKEKVLEECRKLILDKLNDKTYNIMSEPVRYGCISGEALDRAIDITIQEFEQKIKELENEIETKNQCFVCDGYGDVICIYHHHEEINELKKDIERLNKENKLLNTEKLELIRLRKFVEEANNPNSWCINCGHAIDEHGGETLDDLNHCNSCQEVGTDCNDFKPCEYICQIIHKRELQLKSQFQQQRNKIEERVKELEAEQNEWYTKETAKHYNQKIKELEHEIDRLKSSKRWYSEEQIGEFHIQINKQSEQINQLKSQLNSQTEKIKEILKNSKLCDWERILELKSLLSEKE